jgi:hypothetical protein
MSEKGHEEKAFPGSVNPWGEKKYETGMTLRDWLAGQAMAGFCVGVDDPNVTWIAQKAYDVADAMMEARKR